MVYVGYAVTNGSPKSIIAHTTGVYFLLRYQYWTSEQISGVALLHAVIQRTQDDVSSAIFNMWLPKPP